MNLLKKWFTLIELILAIFISSIVLLIVFTFTSDIVVEILYSNQKSQLLVSIDDMKAKMNNYRNIFLTGGVLVDNETGTGSDVLVLQHTNGQDGIVFWVVNADTLQLVDNSNYNSYGEYVLGYRGLSSSELSLLSSNSGAVYDLAFKKDKLYTSLVTSDLQILEFNSGAIFDMTLDFVISFNKWLTGELLFNELPRSDFIRYNINF